MSKTILLVEDEDDDVFFMQHALKKAGISNPPQVARDGREAMNYLGGIGEYADRGRFPLPSLVLLDLKLPRVMGLDVLKWVRAQPELKTLIVIVLTSSQLGPDIESAYQLGANAYLVKPSSAADLCAVAASVKQFWLETNHGPAAPQTPQKLAAMNVRRTAAGSNPAAPPSLLRPISPGK